MGNINLTVPTPFEISLTAASGYSQSITLTPTAGMVAATTIYVRFNPQIPNTYTGNLDITSTAVTSVSIPLTGIGAPNTPVVTLAPSTLNYFITTFGIPSTVQSIAVSGMYLVGPLYVTAPTHWQVSTNATNGFGSMLQLQPTVTGAVSTTTIFVRYNPLTSGNHQGYLNVTSSGAVTKSMQLNGYATPTGVEEIAKDDMFVYPTISSGMISVSEKGQQAELSIYDFAGRLVMKQDQAGASFSIQTLSNGIYMLYLNTGDKRYVTKIIKE
jgi:hypothetical protein